MANKAPRQTENAVVATETAAPAGGGAFAFERVSVGVFLTCQPNHHIGFASDRRLHKPLANGEGWIMPAGMEGICEFDADHRFVTVEIATDLLAEVGFASPTSFEPHIGRHDPLLAQLVCSAARMSGQSHSRLYAETMDRALAAHLAQMIDNADEQVKALDDQRLIRALRFVHDNLAADISLGELSGEAAMSPYHFARAFKEATGKSPMRYVIDERLSAARLMLKTTRLPVAEIAYRVGYGDVSRFGSHFKRMTGTTPAAYRSR